MGQSAFADVPDIPPSIHPRLTFPYTLRTLLLSRLRVQGLRVRFTAFRTSRPRTSRSVYCFLDFASGLLLSRLRVRFTTFRTSRPWTSRPLYCFPDFASMDFASALLLFGLRVHFTCFPRALAHHLPLHILQIPIMLLFYDRRGEPPRRTTTEAVAGTKKGASHDLWLHPLTEHATKEGQAVSTPFWPTGFSREDSRPKLRTLFITRQSEANRRARGHEQ
ncbi:hypothetical protein CDL15_Pgr002717 [Punica granatum]|uniref:Uncharacterized protein n=1 Tax=Punica granatum TaxID=22663 RepID=A0A218XJ97_PUNGR|nr:hypothetical protein CDL15_Pgr002717 [Punica granatum]